MTIIHLSVRVPQESTRTFTTAELHAMAQARKTFQFLKPFTFLWFILPSARTTDLYASTATNVVDKVEPILI